MKLRNKKTGEIKDVESLGHEKSLRDKYGPQVTLSWDTGYENLGECRTYNSLAELNEEWEDYEEPKESREIKFRLMVERDPNVWIKTEYELRELIEMDGSGFLGDDDIIEQSTGLKDKNGKEIYVGDIVQDSKGMKCRVGWNIREAHFGLYLAKKTEYEQTELTDFSWIRGEDLEVIGNIYENPELLGDKNE